MPAFPTIEECREVAEHYAGQCLELHDTRGDSHRVRVVGWIDNTLMAREPRVLVMPEVSGPDGPSFMWLRSCKLVGATYVVSPVPDEVVAVWPFYLEARAAAANDRGPDLKKFPHDCPRCGSPAYRGLNVVECSRAGCGA